ncbi:MAG: serine/threonine protein kinase [Cyanobacteria bacterium REEB67]|nr:serine/threonine protein kinase [Cyanobacteria bacterium REEB67]
MTDNLSQDLELPGEFNVGDVVGNTYVIHGYLGRGAMGHVYYVRHLMLDVEYALKTLSSDKVTEIAWRRFQNEAQAIARLNHPNIVQIYNLGLHQGILPYYAMDLLIGLDLGQQLSQYGPLPVNRAVSVFSEVCAGISFAHKKGIVHRDIKPGNIFLLKELSPAGANVKVVDFGIAKLSETKDPKNQMLTTMGDVVGTPFYMSPEQCLGERVDARSDIYSVGCTLFEALTGVLPFRGRNPTETMIMHQSAAPASLSKAAGGKDFGTTIEYIVATALAKQPSERYQTMDALGRDLQAALHGAAPQIVTGGATVDPPQPAPAGLLDVAPTILERALPAQDANVPLFSPATGRGSRDKGNRKLLLMVGISLLILVLVAGTFFANSLFVARGVRPVSGIAKVTSPIVAGKAAPPVSPGATGPSSAAASTNEKVEDKDNNFGFEDEFTYYTPPFPVDQYPSTSLLLKRPFCEVIDSDGVKFRYFDFPKDISLGVMTSTDQVIDKHLRPYLARGRFRIPVKDVWVTFTPTDAAEHSHGCLKRFSAGDIDCVKFLDQYSSDKTLAEVCEIPDLKMLDFENCHKFTAASVPYLHRFKNLKTFDGAYGPFDGEMLRKANCWATLEDFNLAKLEKPQALVDILPSLKHLRKLTLKDTDLKTADFQTIASLSKLYYLCLDDRKLSRANLQILSTMPNLQELELMGAGVDSSYVDILAKFKGLKILWFQDEHGRQSEEFKKMKKGLPHLDIQYID